MDLAFEQYYFCYLHYFNVVSAHANLTLKIVNEPGEREFQCLRAHSPCPDRTLPKSIHYILLLRRFVIRC